MGCKLVWKVSKICSSLFVTCDYGVKEKRFWKDEDLRRFTPLHNLSNGVQQFVWNCQNKRLYEESSLYQFGWFHDWIFFGGKTRFPTKNHPFFKWKIRKKNAESRWNIFTISDFLHYVECNALGAKTSQKRGCLLLGIPQSEAIHHLALSMGKSLFYFVFASYLEEKKKEKERQWISKNKTIVTFQKAKCPMEWAFHFLKCPIIFGG